MGDVVGIAWFEDEVTYQRALRVFADPENMPATYEDWRALVGRELELVKESGNIAIRADIDPEPFVAWCRSKGFVPNSHGRIAFVRHVEIEYQKTRKGNVIA